MCEQLIAINLIKTLAALQRRKIIKHRENMIIFFEQEFLYCFIAFNIKVEQNHIAVTQLLQSPTKFITKSISSSYRRSVVF